MPMPWIYLENAECLLFWNHRISDLGQSSVFNLIALQVSQVESLLRQVLPEAVPPIWCAFHVPCHLTAVLIWKL